MRNSCSIAAASILAKTHRDRLMSELAVVHPGYGFEKHAGYATAEHLEDLRRLGPCAVHRRSYAALAEHCGDWSAGYYRLRSALSEVRESDGLGAWHVAFDGASEGLADVEREKLQLLLRRRKLPAAPCR